MGLELNSGLDDKIDDVSDITGSAAGWASAVVEVMQGLKSNNNALGTAAGKNAVSGTVSGAVPVLDSNGKIALAQINTATSGGAGSNGLIPLLNSVGQIPASMISSASGGSGVGIKLFHIETRPGFDGQFYYDHAANGDISLLIIGTGGGGSGAHGPPATKVGYGIGSGDIAGADARKGGGGGAGATIIITRQVTSTVDWRVRAGRGGAAMTSTGSSNRLDTNNGQATQVGDFLTAQGGLAGYPDGNGGQSASTTNTGGLVIMGGHGADGTFDRLGGGCGGASFWGGGSSGGGGSDTTAQAWGSGGGAAHGSSGVPPYTFNPNASGRPGANGVVLIIGF